MAKKTVGFRLDEATLDRMADLCRQRGVTRTRLLEELVLTAHEGEKRKAREMPLTAEQSTAVSGIRSRPDLEKIQAAQARLLKGKK